MIPRRPLVDFESTLHRGGIDDSPGRRSRHTEETAEQKTRVFLRESGSDLLSAVQTSKNSSSWDRIGRWFSVESKYQQQFAEEPTPMSNAIALCLFESTTSDSVLRDPANADWLGVVNAVSGVECDRWARQYYLALVHFRSQSARPALPGRVNIEASGKSAAFQGSLDLMGERKESEKEASSREGVAIFVEPRPDAFDEKLPASLRDLSSEPPLLRDLLDGPGRPPCDALCMKRAFLAAPLLGVGDSPTAVNALLRSNPTFASACNFLGRGVGKLPGELTSRRLPSISKLEEFNEVTTRYGLWNAACVEQVRKNLTTGVVEIENTLAFDTTHIAANSHCGNKVPDDAKVEEGKKPRHRKVPLLRKTCGCGKAQWETCEHSWTPTDQGAAVVVKGPTRVYWAHKASVATFGRSEVPLDVRVLQYAAEHDGKTLVPHLELMRRDFPEALAALRHVVADDAYKSNHTAVSRFDENVRLTVPVHPNRQSKADVAAHFAGIDRFTPVGVPVCKAGHRFEMRGRDITDERFIWTAPDDAQGHSACASCPLAATCLESGTRRHIRVRRQDFPQIDWDHPQHLARNRARYGQRTGVERAIKRIKVDLGGEHLTHRDSLRVQAHLDRKLLILHLLLSIAATG